MTNMITSRSMFRFRVAVTLLLLGITRLPCKVSAVTGMDLPHAIGSSLTHPMFDCPEADPDCDR